MAEILKGVWEDDKGNQYYSANDTETTYDQAGTPLNNGGDLSEASVNFSVGTARKALTPKARFKALMGDIAKWLTDLGTAAFCNVANNDTTTVSGFVAGAQIVKTHGDEIDKLNQDLQWKKVGELTGTTAKNIDFSGYKEIYLLTRCAGNMTLAYTAIIPVASLISTALQFCNGGHTSGAGAQCAWNVSLSSCQLMACYSGGTNYTGSNTIIYAR